MIWRGPLREDDRDSQVSEVEGFISRGVSGIVLAPLDESALVGPVADAMSRKIPVVIFDSGLKGDDYVSFVATDNLKGGRLAGERLAQSIGGKGKVVLLRYAEGHDSTGKREQGFLDAMKAHPGIEVVSSNQYGGADVEGAYKKAGVAPQRPTRSPTAASASTASSAPNESSTFAVMRVLQDNGWAGKVKFVGFDASANLVKGLRDGALDGLVVQDPVHMGYLGVKTMVAHLKGEPGRAHDRHRRAPRHARQHGSAGDEGAAHAGPVAMAEMTRRRARSSRCAASRKASARRSRSTASTSPSAPARSAASSARTAPARAR